MFEVPANNIRIDVKHSNPRAWHRNSACSMTFIVSIAALGVRRERKSETLESRHRPAKPSQGTRKGWGGFRGHSIESKTEGSERVTCLLPFDNN